MAAARAFFGYVEEVSKVFTSDNRPLRWIVRVRGGSALLAVDPAVTTPPEVAHAIYARAEHGIRQLIERDIEDTGLPEPALRYLRTLSEMTEAGPNKAPPVPLRLWVEKKQLALSRR